MKNYIFNIHDIFLLFSAFFGVLLAFLQFYFGGKTLTNYLLVFFFSIQSFISLDIILIWNDQIMLNPKGLLAALDLGLIIQGPLVYIYIQSLIIKDYRLLRDARHHLIMAFIFMLVLVGGYLINTLGDIGNNSKLIMVNKIETTSINVLLTIGRSIFCIVYCCMAIVKVNQYRRAIYDTESDPGADKSHFLYLLTIGFLLILLGRFFSAICNFLSLQGLADSVGILSNYGSFLFLIGVFVSGLKDIEAKVLNDIKGENIVVDHEKIFLYIKKIQDAISLDRLHLEYNINLERFSKVLGLSPRLVSIVLNKHLNSNFFEFINSNRVAAAKAMLADPKLREKQIIEIQLDCGFNSKTAFNRFFKKLTGMSPRQYRKQNQPIESDLNH